MLSKKYRFHQPETFFVEAKKIPLRNFLTYVKQAESSDELQVGIVVSKKVSKKAVQRNKIRRHLTPLLQENLEALRGKYLLIVVSERALRASFEDLRDDVEEMVRRIEKL